MANFFLPIDELDRRRSKLQAALVKAGLDGALIHEKINMLYYAGTLEGGVLFIPASGESVFFVRRSLERAKLESPLARILGFRSFKELPPQLKAFGFAFSALGIDESALPLFQYRLLEKNFPGTRFSDITHALARVRSVKSPYELEKLQKAGDFSRNLFARVPSFLKPGITEWELGLRLFHEMALLGNACVTRLNSAGGEFFLGNICFGESSLHPCAFDGPGGKVGRSAGCPHLGGDRALKVSDFAYIDMMVHCDEYCVDKTRLFSLGAPPVEIADAQKICLEIQEAVRERLRPGVAPSDIYREIYKTLVLPRKFEPHFMGYGSNQVKFLGHGVGMAVDEYPVLAEGFDEPLEENMVIAVEPKKGIAGIGMAGIENTFVVKAGGGRNLTQDSDAIHVL